MTEKSIYQKLMLPEDASKGDVAAASQEMSRLMRIIALGIPIHASWSEITAAYAQIPKVHRCAFLAEPVLTDTGWEHPISKKTVHGTRIEYDFTEIEEGDLFACYDGCWRRRPFPWLVYRSCVKDALWIRPTSV